MNHEQYIAHMDARTVGLPWLSTGICPSCPSCQREYDMTEEQMQIAYECGTICDEPHFSWSRCDICGTRFGGDRECGHYCCEPGMEVTHLDSVCVDCVAYLANGDVPTYGPDGTKIID